MARKDLPCSGCGKMMWRGKNSAPDGVAKCLPCRRVHGTPGLYKRGCRCAECVAAHSRRMAAWMQCHTEKHGEHYSSTWRRKFKSEHGFWPQGSGAGFIDAAGRQAIYERDGWVCQLCGGPIDFGASAHADRASLDHIVPQSRGGSHDPSNLRMAHVGCNARRRDRVDA